MHRCCHLISSIEVGNGVRYELLIRILVRFNQAVIVQFTVRDFLCLGYVMNLCIAEAHEYDADYTEDESLAISFCFLILSLFFDVILCPLRFVTAAFTVKVARFECLFLFLLLLSLFLFLFLRSWNILRLRIRINRSYLSDILLFSQFVHFPLLFL